MENQMIANRIDMRIQKLWKCLKWIIHLQNLFIYYFA